MNNPALPHGSTAGARRGASQRREKAREKFFREKAANPIEKSRFGREKSKETQPLTSGGFAAKERRAKKTQTDRPDLRPAISSRGVRHLRVFPFEGDDLAVLDRQ